MISRRKPGPRFDELIHFPHRLRICVLLCPVESMSFQALREELEVADSVLSKQLRALSEAGYVAVNKPIGTGGRPTTWARLTGEGRRALIGHLSALADMSAHATQRRE